MLKKNLLSAEAVVTAASAAAIAEIAPTQVSIVRTRSIVTSPSSLAAPNRTECVRCDLGECHNAMWMPAIGPWTIGLWSNPEWLRTRGIYESDVDCPENAMSPSARCKTAVRICAVALVLVGTSGGAMAQNQAIGF